LTRKIGRQVRPQDVGRQDDAAERLATDLAEGDSHPVEGERDAPLPRSKGDSDDRQHLRHHERGRHALQKAGGDEHAGRRRHARSHRRDREKDHPAEEDPAAAIPVAQSPAGHQAQREGEAVAADDELERGRPAAEVTMQRGGSDVDREEVERVHEQAGEDDRQGQPPAMGRHAR
jgi:hypothetical protein